MLPNAVNRREMLQAAVKVGAAGVSLAISKRLLGETKQTQQKIILVWLDGGPSQWETFDPKPEALEEIRGPLGATATNVPGVHYSELLPRLATHADELLVVRGAHNSVPLHKEASLEYLGQPTVARTVKHSKDAPFAYAAIDTSHYSEEKLYDAHEPEHADLHVQREWEYPLGKISVPNLTPVIPNDQFQSRIHLLHTLQPERLPLQEQAFDILLANDTNAIQRALRPSTEDIVPYQADPNESYGPFRGIAEAMRIAKNLAEAGVAFTTVNFPGWDNHSQIKERSERKLPILDAAISTLIEQTRGQKITIALAGEFGRTPFINKIAGRDHWPESQSVVFSVDKGNGGAYGSTRTDGIVQDGDVTTEQWRNSLHGLLGNDIREKDVIPGLSYPKIARK